MSGISRNVHNRHEGEDTRICHCSGFVRGHRVMKAVVHVLSTHWERIAFGKGFETRRCNRQIRNRLSEGQMLFIFEKQPMPV
ncbi:hypothetical protein TNCT_703311 [Trichonephila clavata]|uniref:Uncharacterized protein n=1 Tax=Trichonephila clavata TaxID=2740835 RepID=A0A8X6JGA0_TRICU|nr:hypothetical protein TNCT_703311 [Trichonephila clavata]